MLILITGGSGSGKSAFAEQKLLEIASEQGKNCIYLATMSRGEDGESAARIRRHRALRAGKGFGTVEQPLRLDEAKIPDGSAVLLEDLSNLLANEIYLPGGQLAIKERTEEQLAEAVLVGLDPGPPRGYEQAPAEERPALVRAIGPLLEPRVPRVEVDLGVALAHAC